MDRILLDDNSAQLTITSLGTDGKYALIAIEPSSHSAIEFYLDKDQLSDLIDNLIDHQEESEIE